MCVFSAVRLKCDFGLSDDGYVFCKCECVLLAASQVTVEMCLSDVSHTHTPTLLPWNGLVMSPCFQFNDWVSRPWAPCSPLAATDNIIKRMCGLAQLRKEEGMQLKEDGQD